MNKLVSLITMLLFFYCVEVSAWDGKGTKESPYLISTVNDMVRLSEDVANYITYEGKYFKVIVPELDFKNVKYSSIGTDNYYYDHKEGRNKHACFYGSFDGQGVIIKNLILDDTTISCVGLFGKVIRGDIMNITIDSSCSIQGGGYVGGIVGDYQGGGSNNPQIINCVNNANISGKGSYVGGIAGRQSCAVVNCVNTGNITGYNNLGGIVGYNSSSWAQILSCQSSGNVTGSGEKIGGITGYCDFGELKNNIVSAGTITSTDRAGAVIGCGTSKYFDNYYYPNVIVISGGIVFDGPTPRGLGFPSPTDIVENDGAVLITIQGDANGDAEIDEKDIKSVAQYIIEENTDNFFFKNADVNADNKVNVSDIVIVTNMINDGETDVDEDNAGIASIETLYGMWQQTHGVAWEDGAWHHDNDVNAIEAESLNFDANGTCTVRGSFRGIFGDNVSRSFSYNYNEQTKTLQIGYYTLHLEALSGDILKLKCFTGMGDDYILSTYKKVE